MKMLVRFFVFFILFPIFFISCVAKRPIETVKTKEIEHKDLILNEILDKQKNTLAFEQLKVSGTLDLIVKNNYQGNLLVDQRSKFNLDLVRDKGLRIVLVPFPFVEAGRLYSTDEKILLINNLGHNYFEIGYNKINQFTKGFIDAYSLQYIFLARMLFPSNNLEIKYSDFERKGNMYVLKYNYSTANICYSFDLEKELRQIEYEDLSQQLKIIIQYDAYQELEGREIPKTFSVEIHSEHYIKLIFDFRKILISDKDESVLKPKIKSSYNKHSFENLLKMLS